MSSINIFCTQKCDNAKNLELNHAFKIQTSVVKVKNPGGGGGGGRTLTPHFGVKT